LGAVVAAVGSAGLWRALRGADRNNSGTQARFARNRAVRGPTQRDSPELLRCGGWRRAGRAGRGWRAWPAGGAGRRGRGVGC